MLNVAVEKMTAEKAIKLSLIERVKEGAAVIEGNFTLKKGEIEYYPQTFTFNDKYEVFRAGRFEDAEEFLKFMGQLNETAN